MSEPGARYGVLFVCLGNICRSPLAKFIFADMVRRRGMAERFEIDSCGTGAWHAGDSADPRTVAVARKHGLDTTHTARVLRPQVDFERFDLLAPMDLANKARLLSLGAPEGRVRLLRSFDPSLAGLSEPHWQVPDPYYGEGDGFEENFRMISAACEGLMVHAMQELGL